MYEYVGLTRLSGDTLRGSVHQQIYHKRVCIPLLDVTFRR